MNSSGLFLLYVETYVKGSLLLYFLVFAILLTVFFLLIRNLYLLEKLGILSGGCLRDEFFLN